MIVISDSSILIALTRVGMIEILPLLFGEILIPPAVAMEISVENRFGSSALIHTTWLQVTALKNPSRATDLVLGQSGYGKLHIGEAEAIILAVEVNADALLIDERRGRKIARQHGLDVVGVLGVLALAKSRGIIPEIRSALDALINEAGFRVGKALYQAVLKQAGE